MNALLKEAQFLNLQRRYPIGAEVQPIGGTHFRVWAPRAKKVEVVLEVGPGAPATVQLKPQTGGYFAGLAPQAANGTRYRFRLDTDGCFPDPMSPPTIPGRLRAAPERGLHRFDQ